MKKILNERIAISSSNPIRARFYDYRGFTYPWHFHSEYELMFVEQGYGKCLVGDSIIDYRAGDLIFFGSGLPHCMQNCPEAEENEAYHVYGVNIQLEKDFMQYSFSHYTQFASIRSLLEKAHRGIRFPLAGRSEIAECLKRIPVAHGVEQIIEILRLLQALSAFPRKQFAASPNYLPDPSVFGDKKIEKIIAYLNKRYTQPVTYARSSTLPSIIHRLKGTDVSYEINCSEPLSRRTTSRASSSKFSPFKARARCCTLSRVFPLMTNGGNSCSMLPSAATMTGTTRSECCRFIFRLSSPISIFTFALRSAVFVTCGPSMFTASR